MQPKHLRFCLKLKSDRMKKYYSVIFLFVICIKLHSQTLSKSDIMPVTGQTFTTHTVDNVNAINVGSSGDSQTWDISNINYTTANDYYYMVLTPSSTPYASTFSSASFAVKSYPASDSTYLYYDYFKDTLSSFFEMGEFGPVLATNYSDPEISFPTSMNLNDSFTDNFCYTSTAFSVTSNYCGNSTLKFDGAGTLTLPYGIYTNVFRFKYSAIVVRQSPVDTSIITKYFWYKAGTHKPLVEYINFLSSNSSNIISAKILSANSITGVSEIAPDYQVSIYPNPCKEKLTVVLSENKHAVLKIYTMEGKLILNRAVEKNKGEVDMENLPAGMYLLSVESGEDISRTKLVKN